MNAKELLIVVFFIFMAIISACSDSENVQKSTPEAYIESQISDLMASMTLHEKVGQMIQGEIHSVSPEDVRTYGLGSVLNAGGSYPNRNKRAAPRDWLAIADAY